MVIEEGVQPGDTLVVTGQLALSPGAKVSPQMMNSANQVQGELRGQ